jgi:DNA-binding HxlR family transcriptional regulator
MKPYGSFCPVSKAAEIFAERWTPLIVRELLLGSHRFNEIEIGVPGIPKALLSQRLRSLEAAGVVARRETRRGRTEYELTEAGQDLYGVVVALGEWGHRWANNDIGPRDVDPTLLMWDIRRRINLERLPDYRVVVQFNFRGLRERLYWLVLEKDGPSVCFNDPGFDIDLVVTTDTIDLHRVWMGRLELAAALRRRSIVVDGPAELTRAFPGWLALSPFAGIQPAATSA